MPGIWSSYICGGIQARHCFKASVLQCAVCMFDESLFASDYHAFDACKPVDYCITQSTKSNVLSLLRIWIITFCKPMFGYLHVFCLYSCGGIEGVSFYVNFSSVYVWFVSYLPVWIVRVQRRFFFFIKECFL